MQHTIENKILDFAKNNENIRALLLNGSRANPNIKPDKYQDYDFCFIVEKLQDFISDKSWLEHFGKPYIYQFPHETFNAFEQGHVFTNYNFLVIFEAGYRIDFSFFEKGSMAKDFKIDSLTICYLDKDNLFENLPPTSEKDYYINAPSEKEFLDTANEFYWVATYVAKGLARKEILYAKDMLENVVRPMFNQMLFWHIALPYNFKINLGKSGKFVSQYLSEKAYNEILKTYTNADIESNFNALFLMLDLFEQWQKNIAEKLAFNIHIAEAKNTKNYMQKLYAERSFL